MDDAVADAIFDSDVEILFECGNCGTRLPKEDFELGSEGVGAVAKVDCPTCGDYNGLRIS